MRAFLKQDSVAAEAKVVQDSIKDEFCVAMGIGVGGEGYPGAAALVERRQEV